VRVKTELLQIYDELDRYLTLICAAKQRQEAIQRDVRVETNFTFLIAGDSRV